MQRVLADVISEFHLDAALPNWFFFWGSLAPKNNRDL